MFVYTMFRKSAYLFYFFAKLTLLFKNKIWQILDVEDFGNIPIYAGSEEETAAEKYQKLQNKRLGPRRPK